MKSASPLFTTLFLGMARLRHYPPHWFRSDLLAGITVAAYLIPQCMAYGELAGVNPVQGLWAMLPAIILYAMTGSSPQLSVGPESPTAMMTAAAVAPLVLAHGTSHATLAAVLGILVGVLCLVGYVARLGFLANLLSKPILIGYMAGVAVIMIMGQLSKVSGVPIEATNIAGQVADFLGNLDQIHWPTFALSGFVLVLLFGVQARFPRAPGPLLAVLVATAVVSLFHLDRYGVVVVGTIPAGLPSFQVPMVSQPEAFALLSAAAGIAIVGYSDNVLTARALAARNHYSQLIDPNQELLALGIVNLGTGLFQGFPVSSSGSRAAIGNAMGSKSQVFSLVAFGVVLLVLFFLRPLLVMFPTAALGALVIYAATRLVELPEFTRLQHFRQGDYALAVLTTLGVLATDLLVGVAIAVGLSVIELFARIARPYDAVMGKVPDLPGLHDVSDWSGATTIPGLVLYRYDAPLFFANVNNFKRRALAAIEAEQHPVEWFVLNAEAIAEIDITAADMLNELFDELKERGITFAMARVKQDLYAQLQRCGLLDRIGVHHIYFTLPTAIDGFHQRHAPPAPPGTP
ncbi:MAG: solute carrier family 26 protein [Leptolyngbya sp.]|nr:solute carrier family 26 protein [Leptolyngbya sp.]